MTPTLTPQTRPATREALREIARLPDGPALSVIFNLDPREFGTAPARATAIRSLQDDVRRSAGDELQDEADAVMTYLQGGEFDQSKGRAVALFASSEAGYFETMMLPEPLPTSVAALPYPGMAPVAHLMAAETWCVALVDRAAARILTGTARDLQEFEDADDDVHRRHSAGGGSQARWERSVEVEVDRHLEHVAEVITRAWRRGFDRLALGATAEMEPRTLDALGGDERGRYSGRFDVDVQNTTVEEVADAAGVLFAMRDWERIREALGRAASRAGDGLSASGPENVSSALEQMRVATLVVDPSLDRASFFVRQAALQDAVVLTAPAEPLREHQGAVAVLRF
ncbi:MAG TPA: Vms1/Ankzf1 family peptidyl-tRNA hydrolase [Actinomycetota bacterium]|nr:Vms1/Ankzf1 family peptidyl-tRNA hydrolase [Actinomycetota bacterium]